MENNLFDVRWSKFAVRIEGISPMLVVNTNGIGKIPVLDETPEQEAGRKLYKDNNGNIGITTDMLYGCLRDAGRFEKVGKKIITMATGQTMLPSFFDIQNEFLTFEKEATSEWHVDVRFGKNDKGQAIKLVRPMIDKWAIDGINISVNEKEVHEETIKRLFYHGGTKMGLGAFRPSCGGRFGRFKVVKWEKKM